MTTDRLSEIRARLNAASKGPWSWSGDTRFHTVELSNWEPGWGRCTVLRAARAGMQQATFIFRDDHMMNKRAEELAVYEVEPTATSGSDPRVYRHDITGLRHPDAELIAAAPSDIAWLLAEVERLSEKLDMRTEQTVAAEAETREYRAEVSRLSTVIEAVSASVLAGLSDCEPDYGDYEISGRWVYDTLNPSVPVSPKEL